MSSYGLSQRTPRSAFLPSPVFIGIVALTAVMRKILATLAAYSYYAGTGRKTTMGMGLTRQL